MFEALTDLDRALFFYINSLNAPWLDSIMSVISGVKIWIPFYLAIIGFLIYTYGKRSISIIVFIGLLIGTTDVVAARVIKPFFERNRPCHAHDLQSFIHTPDGCGGQFGFVSNHAANTFALATFLTLMLAFRHPKVKYIYFWAFAVAYSRVYLGKHYPADIFFGAMFGFILALIYFRLYFLAGALIKKPAYFLVHPRMFDFASNKASIQ